MSGITSQVRLRHQYQQLSHKNQSNQLDSGKAHSVKYFNHKDGLDIDNFVARFYLLVKYRTNTTLVCFRHCDL